MDGGGVKVANCDGCDIVTPVMSRISFTVGVEIVTRSLQSFFNIIQFVGNGQAGPVAQWITRLTTDQKIPVWPAVTTDIIFLVTVIFIFALIPTMGDNIGIFVNAIQTAGNMAITPPHVYVAAVM
uniref:Uncharacterized protein n=1 Tax=Glossina austeni TaxID=7395 RepID=A0A1A9V5K4_GLOAU